MIGRVRRRSYCVGTAIAIRSAAQPRMADHQWPRRLRLRHIAGIPTRKYHGCSCQPGAPKGRHIMISRCDECVGQRAPDAPGRRRVRGRRFEGESHLYLKEFRLDHRIAVWTFELDGVVFEKSIAMAAQPEHGVRAVSAAAAAKRWSCRCGRLFLFAATTNRRASTPAMRSSLEVRRGRHEIRTPKSARVALRRCGPAHRVRHRGAREITSCIASSATAAIPSSTARSARLFAGAAPARPAGRCSSRRCTRGKPGVRRDRRVRRRAPAPRRLLALAPARGRPGGRATGDGSGSIHRTAGQPPGRKRAGAGGRRRVAQRLRRLSLVRRLGPRHDDQPRRADALYRPLSRGRRDPEHLLALREGWPAPQSVSGRQRQALYHTVDATLWYFHAISRYVDATGDRALVRICFRCCSRSSSITSPARASTSTSIPKTA